jgi:hypothetical protein
MNAFVRRGANTSSVRNVETLLPDGSQGELPGTRRIHEWLQLHN